MNRKFRAFVTIMLSAALYTYLLANSTTYAASKMRPEIRINENGAYGDYRISNIQFYHAKTGSYTFHVNSPTKGAVELHLDGEPVSISYYDWQTKITSDNYHLFNFPGHLQFQIYKAGNGTINLHNLNKSIFNGTHALETKRYSVLGFKPIEFEYQCDDPKYCPNGTRRVVMEIYYPATHDAADLKTEDLQYEFCNSEYSGNTFQEVIADTGLKVSKELVMWKACRADNIGMNAVRDAPLFNGTSNSKLPVIFFSSGQGDYVRGYDRLFRPLVEAGFVLVTLAHPEIDSHVAYEDGRVFFNQKLGYTPNPYYQVQRMGIDAAAALHELQQSGNNEHFDNRLRLTKNEGGVGYMGHSLGGAAGTWVTNWHSDFVSAINIDGSNILVGFPPLATINVVDGMKDPWMMISSQDNWLSHFTMGLFNYKTIPNGYAFNIAGSTHYSFHDVCGKGSLGRSEWILDSKQQCGDTPKKVDQIVHDYAEAFFRQHLLGQEQLMLKEGASRDDLVKNFLSWECDANPKRCKSED